MDHQNYIGFITDTVETMLPCFTKDVVLTMKVHMSWSDYSSEKAKHFGKSFLLVFYRPSAYTKVLGIGYHDRGEFSMYRLEGNSLTLKQFSDHDSCWRSDGMNWVFDTFCKAWEFFEKHGIDGRKIDPMVHWDNFGGKPTYWLVDSVERTDKDNNNRYMSDYKVKFKKELTMQEAVKYFPKNS